MKIIVFIFFCLFFKCSIAQCIPTTIINNVNPVCGDQFIGQYNTGIIKINLTSIASSNKHVFSTVGESYGDTYLSLYDSYNNLISSNDDDTTCGGCKQSTLTYGPISGGSNVSGLYLILSKPDCKELDFSTNLKFSARNEYDLDPKIDSPIETVQCLGSVVNFTYSLPKDVNGDNLASPWESIDESIATIDQVSGVATFINNGIAKIKLKVKSTCEVINNYIVNGSLTSTIIKH